MLNVSDFLLNNFSQITLSVEILAAVIGLILFKKYKHTAAKYFIYFLVYVVIIVLIGKYSHYVKDDGFLSFLDGTLLERNYWWYTIFWKIGAVLFFGWYYLKILLNTLHKKVLKVSLIAFLII